RGTRARLEWLELVVLCVGALAATTGTAGEPYAGKTLRIAVGYPPGGGFDTYARLLARHLPQRIQATLGLPIHLVRGYRGTAEIRLAVQSGEVDGFCSLWDSQKTVWPDGLESGAAVAVIPGGARPLPGLPGVPVAVEPARTEEACQLIRAALILPGTLARGYAVPPDTPPDLVRLLRAVLMETLQAPAFLADARRTNLEVDPVSGEQLEQVMAELFGLNGTVLSK